MTLHPIEIGKSQNVRKFLKQIGLPIIAEWLNMKRNPTWFIGYRYFQIGINDSVTKYCILETQNDNIITKNENSI